MKNAIVTGAARGIGRVIANRLADDGWRVGLADISIAAIENEEPLRANCVALEADVSKPDSISAALAAFGATPDSEPYPMPHLWYGARALPTAR